MKRFLEGVCPRNAKNWLSGMDLNHDKSLQRALCYHYTTGQTGRTYFGVDLTSNKKTGQKRRG